MPVPYSVRCTNCGEKLNIAKRIIDKDDDLLVEVDPCQTCIDKAVDEAEETSGKRIVELEDELAEAREPDSE